MAVPSTEIILDKPRKLRLSFAAALEFEENTGKKLIGLDVEKLENVGKLLWIMLKQDEPELTYKKTLELVEEYAGGFNEISIPVWKAAQAAFTGKKIEDKSKVKNGSSPKKGS